MAIQTTTWKPDTCGCKINYTWDDAVPEEERTFSIGEGSVKCAVHSSHENDADLFSAVLEENTSKNIALAEIAKELSGYAKTDEKGNITPDLEKLQWSFDDKRKLEITLLEKKEGYKETAIAALERKLTGVTVK